MQPEQFGPYRIGPRLGRGGMGAVYEAVDTTTGATVAVKVLATHLADDPGLKARFRAEIETLKELRHPGIVQLLAYGDQDDQPYFAMEIVRGQSLEQLLRGGRRFSWQETVATALSVTKALKLAHDHGVVHRDLKPANLLLTENLAPGEGVKLADFGIAKLFGGAAHTAHGNIIGTAEYMAPEQAAGKGIDHRADLYALGLVMFAMLAGRPPFRGGQVTEIIEKQRRTPAPRVSSLAADVPPELDALIDRLLSKDPSARPASALALNRLLTAIETFVPGAEAGAALSPEQLVIHDATLPHTLDADPAAAAGSGDRTTIFGQTPGASGGGRAGMANQGTESPVHTPRPSAPRQQAVPAVLTAGVHDDATFQQPAEAGASTRVDTSIRNRFTTVAELQRLESVRLTQIRSRQAWWRGGSAVLLLGVILGGGYLLLRPFSADDLYARITMVADSDAADLRDADDSIRRFLTRYPDDPRAGEVRRLNRTMEIDRLERRARRKVRSDRLLAPIERDYRAAMAREHESPSVCLEALRALVALHPDSNSDAADAAEVSLWLELAQRQIARLTPLAIDEQQQDARRIDATFAAAASLESDAAALADPAARADVFVRRRAILESIIHTYADRPHAAHAVRSASALLAEPDIPGATSP